MMETAATRRMVEKAKKVLGPVAEALSADALKESSNESEFAKKFVEKLARITGNKALVENILKNGNTAVNE